MAPGPGRPFGYAPYESLEERPHVMVDGAARRSSVLTLSHWPRSPTPPELASDLSAGIALQFLRYQTGRLSAGRRDQAGVLGALSLARGAEAVTSDHFDEDGLMSVFALMEPEIAFRREALLLDVASCGDFGVVSSREAAAISFAINPLASLEAGDGAGTSERYLALLPRTEDLLARPDDYEALWGTEMSLVEEGRAALQRGHVEITDDLADLAIVRRVAGTPVRLPGAAGALPVHAVVVHSATPASRILAFDGQRCELYLRYESWVRYQSRPVPLRPELSPLAAELTSLEPGGITWEANGAAAIVSRLRPEGEGVTELAPELIAERVRSYLVSAPAAWDPFETPGTGPSLPRPRRKRRGAGRAPRRGNR